MPYFSCEICLAPALTTSSSCAPLRSNRDPDFFPVRINFVIKPPSSPCLFFFFPNCLFFKGKAYRLLKGRSQQAYCEQLWAQEDLPWVPCVPHPSNHVPPLEVAVPCLQQTCLPARFSPKFVCLIPLTLSVSAHCHWTGQLYWQFLGNSTFVGGGGCGPAAGTAKHRKGSPSTATGLWPTGLSSSGHSSVTDKPLWLPQLWSIPGYTIPSCSQCRLCCSRDPQWPNPRQ